MAVFVIQFRNLNDQISKLEKQTQKYDTQIRETGQVLQSHDLQQEIEDLKAFKTDLFELITEAVRIPTSPQQDEEIVESIFDENSERESFSDLFRKDTFGNELEAADLYNYAEISYGSYDYFLKVRLLGVKDFTKIRYEITDLYHQFSPTTLKLLENIRDITADTNLLAVKDLLTCSDKRDAWKKDLDTIFGRVPPPEYKYTWSEFIENFLVPKGVVVDDGEEMSDEERRALVAYYNKKSTLTKDELIKQNTSIQQNKEALLKKVEKEVQKPIDIIKELQKALKEQGEKVEKIATDTVMNFLDKHSLGCIIKEALQCVIPANFTCRDFFKDLSVVDIFDRISLVFPRASDTFRQIETVVEENVLGTVGPLKKQIEEKQIRIEEDKKLLQEIEAKEDTPIKQVQTLSANIATHEEELEQLKKELKSETTRVAGDLSLSERQKRALEESGNLGAILALPVQEGEEIGLAAISDKVIRAIDLVVPLEDLCEAITNAISMTGGQFPYIQFEGAPKLDFPKPRPVNDIFSGISIELNDLFIQGLIQGMLNFLEGFLDQALSCDALDELIAAALGAPPNTENQGIWGDLGLLFGGNLDFPNSQQILDQQVQQFIDQTTPLFENIIDIKVSGSGEDPNIVSTSIGLDASSTAAFLRGEETTFEEQAAAALEQTLVENVSSNRDGVLQLLLQQGDNPLGNWDISFDGEKFEITSGLRIFDIADIDKFINSVSVSAIKSLENIGTDQFSLGALQDAIILINKDKQQTEPQLEEPSSVTQAATKEEISKEFSATIRACSAMLTPTETINLLAGVPSPNSLKLTKELMSLKSPKLAKVFKSESQIKNLFANFGKLTGLSELKTELEIIASSPEGRKKIISANACRPYDNMDDFRRQLLSKEVDPELARQIVDNINAEKVNNLKNLGNSVLEAAKGRLPSRKPSPSKEQATKAILGALRDGEVPEVEDKTVPSSKALQNQVNEAKEAALEQSDAFKDILNTTVQSLFIPIRDSFDDDMKNYGELLSTTKEQERRIKRFDKIRKDGEDVEVITSEFRQIINSGLVPIVDPNNSKRAILVPANGNGEPPEGGTINGEKSDNFLDKNLPLYKKENVKLVGYAFKKAHEDLYTRTNVRLTADDEFFISIKGSQVDNNAMVQFASLFDQNSPMMDMISQAVPKWTISLSEKPGFSEFNILPTGSYYTPIYGLQNFGSKLTYTSTTPQTDPEIRRILNENFGRDIRLDSFSAPADRSAPLETIPGRHKTFVSLIDRNGQATSTLTNQQQKQKFYDILRGKHEGAIKTFFDLVSKGLQNSPLLKEIEVTNASLLAEQPEARSITAIQLIDFIRQPTEKEKDAGLEPHIMDFAYLEKMFKEIYDKNKQKVQSDLQQLRGLKKRESRFAKSGSTILAKMFIKLSVADYLFKTIFVVDFFDFSKYFSKLELINNHISNNIYSELVQKQNYEIMVPAIKELYKEELQRNNVEKITQKEISDYNNGLINFIPEIKKVVEAEAYQLYCKISGILCKKQESISWNQFMKPILQQIPEIELHPREPSRYVVEQSGLDDIVESAISNSNVSLLRDRVYQKLFEKYRKAQTSIGTQIESNQGTLLLQQTNTSGNTFLTENSIFVMERYIKFGKLNEDFLRTRGYPQVWIDTNKEKLENKEIPFSKLEDYLSIFVYQITSRLRPRTIEIDEIYDFTIFDCDNSENSLFTSIPYYGIKMSLVYDTNDKDFENSQFFYNEKEEEIQNKKYSNNFLSFPFVSSEQTARKTMTFTDFVALSRQGIYEQIREELINSDEVKMMFGYAIPIKEISSMMVMNSYYVHSDERFINFYEPTKIRIFEFMEMLSKIGMKTGTLDSYMKIKDSQKRARDNQGNPAGPIDLDALKAFIRTPIQILKGQATLVDPNIAITDKIVAAANIIAGLTGEKIFLPYSAVSLSLLPFPLFTPPPVGIVPPLTAYNIVTPLGPIFLALEPLLWDLPYFQKQAQDSDDAKKATGTAQNGEETCLTVCNNDEENNNE